MIEWAFDHYHDYDEMAEILQALAEMHSDLSELYSIGQSTEGRELWLIEITDKKTGPSDEKPAVYVDGNTHSAEVTGREVCLWRARNIRIKSAYAHRVFFISAVLPNAGKGYCSQDVCAGIDLIPDPLTSYTSSYMSGTHPQVHCIDQLPF